MSTPTPWSARSPGAVAADELGEGVVDDGELGVEIQDPPAQGPQRELRGGGDDVTAGSQPGRRGGQRWAREMLEAGAQVVGSGEAQMADLVEAPHPGLTAPSAWRPAGPASLPSTRRRSWRPLDSALRAPPGPLRRRRADRTCRWPVGPAGSVDRPRSPRSRRAAGTGPGRRRRRRCPRPRPAPGHRSRPASHAGPGSRRCRRERLDTQHTAIGVQRRRDMHIEVRIHTARDRARALYDGHRHPFSLQLVKGWHARPGKETVNDHAVRCSEIGHPPERGVPRYSTKRRNVASTRHANADPINDTATSSLAVKG